MIRKLTVSFLLLFAMASSASAQAPAQGGRPPVLVGLDAEFGHVTSTSDDAIKMGMLVAIDEINASGGVLGGRPFALVERDSRSVPARGRANFEELAAMTDIVGVFVGKFSPVAIEQAPLANALRLPLLDPWAAADEIISDKPAGTYTFRLSLRDSWAVPAMMKYLRGKGVARVGVMLPASGWGRSNEAQIARHTARGDQPKVVGTHWYNWGVASLSDPYGKLLAAGAQAILFVGNEGEGSLLVKEIAALPPGGRRPVVSHWGVAGGNFIELAGPALKEVDFALVQTVTLAGRRDARAQAVVARAAGLFKLKGADDIPSQAGFAHAYDLMHILARAVAIAGSTDRSAVRAALERVRDYDGLIKRYARPFSESSHEALSPSQVFIGRFNDAGVVVPIAR